jgi:hypothetical protein
VRERKRERKRERERERGLKVMQTQTEKQIVNVPPSFDGLHMYWSGWNLKT